MKKIILFVAMISLATAYSVAQTITANKTYICEEETVTYTISGLPTNTIFEWQTSTNMVLQTSPTATSATYKAVFDRYKGYARVSAVIISRVNGQIVKYVDNSSVWVGAPAPTFMEITTSGNCGYNKVCIGNEESLTMNSNMVREQGITEYDWKFYEWQLYYTGYESRNGIQKAVARVRIPANAPPRARVVVTPYNRCPSSISSYHAQYIDASSYYSRSAAQDTDAKPAEVKVYSFNSGKLVHHEKAAIGFNIRNTTLEDGIYIVETTDSEGNVTRDKVMKNK